VASKTVLALSVLFHGGLGLLCYRIDGRESRAATAIEMAETRKREAEKPAEPPMTRQRAAEQCWMGTEKGSAGVNIDKRADTVTKCIDDKMKTAAAAPKG